MRHIQKLLLAIILVSGAISGCHQPRHDEPPSSSVSQVQEGSSQHGERALPSKTTKADAPTGGNGSPARTSAAKFEVPADPALPYKHEAVQTDASHVYSLPELIDLAQRSNPTTRIAWERARQAAFEVGLVEATYLPDLSAEVLGGFQHITFPIPQNLVPKGYFTTDTTEALPSLVLKWLLFDFGHRAAMANAAKQLAKAANVGFTGAHQQLIFEVSKAYFALDAERAQLRVAESTLKTAQVLREAAEAKYGRGLATVVEVATARRGVAKAFFELEQARAVDNDAYHALLETMGLTPTLKLNIAPSAGRSLPTGLSEDVDTLIKGALVRRPDIVAALAKLRASEAGVKAARATYYPTIGVEGLANFNIAGLRVDGGPSYTVNQPAAGFLLKLKLPIYDGGIRDKNVSIARSKETAAKQELVKTQDEAVRQVARAYDTLKSALAQHEAARAYAEAAEKELEAALEAYKQGVGTLPVAETAETGRTQAQAAQARAYAAVLSSAAALAFTTGELTSSDVLERQQ